MRISELRELMKGEIAKFSSGDYQGKVASGQDNLVKSLEKATDTHIAKLLADLTKNVRTAEAPKGSWEEIEGTHDGYGYGYGYDNSNNQCVPGTFHSSFNHKYILHEEGVNINDLELLKEYREAYIGDNRPVDSTTKITHHVWMTNPNNPKEISTDNVQITLSSIKQFDSSWKRYLWTNDENMIPNALKDDPSIIVKNIEEENFPLKNEIENFASFSKYNFVVMASDIVRLEVVNKYGGLYMDLDYKICKPIDEMLSNYDFIGGIDTAEDYHVCNAMFYSSKSNHPVISGALDTIKRNLDEERVPEYVKSPCNLFSYVIFTTGPAVLTSAFYKNASKDGNKDVVFPHEHLFNYPLSVAARDSNNKDVPAITDDGYCEALPEHAIGNDKFGGSWLSTESWDSQWLQDNYNDILGDLYGECPNNDVVV